MRSRQSGMSRSLVVMAIVALGMGSVAASVMAADPITFRLGTTQAASKTGLNPYLAVLSADYTLMPDQYDLLIEFGPNLEPAPGLAVSWDVTDGGKTWTYHLRPNVKWSDGEPFTSEDVRFQFQYIRDSHDPKYKGPQAPNGNDTDGDGSADNPVTLFDSYIDYDNGLDASRVVSFEATDPLTFVIKTKQPIITLSQMYVPILPKHIWQHITFAKAIADNLTLDQAIGTGPFRVTEFKPKQAIIEEANPDYWGGKPHVDRLIYQYFPNDAAQATALQNNEVDFLDSVPAGLVANIQTNTNVKVNIAKSADFAELAFNSWDPTTPQRFKTEGCKDCPKGPTTGSLGDPWLTKPAVRAALAGLVDKPALIQQAMQGYADPGVSIVSPLNPLYAYQPPAGDPVTFPEYDPNDDASHQAARDEAKQRFKDAMAALGFEDTDGNGILNVPNTPDAQLFDPKGAGKDWSLRLFARQDDEEDKLAAELLQTWFQDAGVTVDYQQVTEDPQLYDATYPSNSNADYDMYIWGWGPDPDPNFILSVFACNQINGWQDVNYCDPAYDQMYADQRVQSDLTARADIVKQMQDKVYHDAPYSVMWYANTLEAYRVDKWEGFNPVPAQGGSLWSAFGFGPYGSRVSVGAIGAAGGTPPPIATPAPSEAASPAPSVAPVESSSPAPSGAPTAAPTTAPIATPAPTAAPVATPTAAPPAPSPSPSAETGTGGGGTGTLLVIGGVIAVAALAGGFWYLRRTRDEDNDE